MLATKTYLFRRMELQLKGGGNGHPTVEREMCVFIGVLVRVCI